MELHACLFSVLPKARFPRKGFAAPWARERPLPRVNHHVLFQLVVQSEGFATHLARERPQPDMFGSAVSHQMRSPLVARTAVVTLERPFLRMLDHVELELCRTRPAFPAGVAEVRLLPRVLIQVPFKVCFLIEFLSAYWAWIATRVPHHVRSQAVFCTELFPAVGANTRLPFPMLALVQNQISKGFEAFPARFTNARRYTCGMYFLMIV